MSATVRPAPSGPLLWAATVGSIGVWMVHLIAEASLVPLRDEHPSVVWIMHAVTVVLALTVLAGLRVSWSYARLSTDDESSGSPGGRTVFLGLVGLVIGALDLLLIIYEGVIIVVLHRGP